MQPYRNKRIKENYFQKRVCLYSDKQYVTLYVRNLTIHTPKISHTVHLVIRYLLVFTYFFRIEQVFKHKTSFPFHANLILLPK